ncbi:MAG: 50S ribosomal protein L1 [Armatimonadetes bacterium]|nr:50S ribosomal protein L1 [Armatimonadota bacterium]NIM24726.1 50S ribosomal protein L1 [Armatimonadota bacterium]NIM68606.1 50S ribosomal protein L1 [Armatimonadota bacterium]NIM77123.1 50S ribosomal protein L1 [Armatimonadota bacterium]NIN06800.1 50S ribosomal protein L1 [Armatimonadota bacterium]
MATVGKRYRALVKELNKDEPLAPQQALALMKEKANAKFDETVELTVALGVDASKGDQMVRGVVALPHGSGKTPRVAVFARGEMAQEAEQAGADEVGAEDLVKKIDEGWRDFDILVASRELMRMVGRLGKKLGPRMPNPKSGTVTDEIGKTVAELKKGRVEFRMDKGGVVHAPMGKASYTVEQLLENMTALLSVLLRARPASAKGQFLRKITLSTTMGPGIPVDPTLAREMAEQ